MTSRAKWSDFASLDGARTLAAANQLLPAWATLLVLVIIAWQLAQIVWSLVPGTAAGSVIEIPAGASTDISRSGDAANVRAIANAHIFGQADPEDVAISAPLANVEVLEDTDLTTLTLKGTIASPDPDFAVAIIADSGNDEEVYMIGDPITAGATLHAVYNERVVLDQRGRLTNLRLPEEFSSVRPQANRRVATTTQRTSINSRSLQDVVTRNATRLADVIRPTPYFVNGQQQGYRVYPGRDRQQFAALGLRAGDLIKEIDGQSLTDPTQAMQIFQSLGTASQVSVTVERDGQPQTLTLQTSQLDMNGKPTQ